MTMLACIEAYIEIENNPRYHRQRGRLMSDLLMRYPDLDQASFVDLLMLLDQLKSHRTAIRMPLFAQVIYPVLAREIESGNAQAIKVLLEHPQSLLDYNRMKKIRHGYTTQALISRYLQHDPNDHDVLFNQEACLS